MSRFCRLAVGLALLAYASSAFAQVQDVTAPNLTALSFAPTTIDTTSGPATVSLNLTATDDIAGLDTYQFGFSGPSHTHSVGGSGTFAGELAASRSATATFPRFSEAGTWTLDFVFLVDRAGNARSIGTAALAAAGFPTQLTVVSITDTTAPNLTALSFAPTTIDTTSSPATVSLNLTATDDISGLDTYQFGFIGPSHTHSVGGSGTFAGELAASRSATATFPQFSEIGVWTLEFVFLVDRVGNARSIGPAALAAAGFPTQLLVTSPSVHLVIPSSTTLWLGLTSNNLAQRFDLRAELYINGDRLISAAETRCVTDLSRSPSMAKEVAMTFGPVLDSEIVPGDVLSFRLLTRIGTNPDGNPCSDAGHAGSPGLRLYYDAVSRASRFSATITPEPLLDFFLHTTNINFFDSVAPAAEAPQYKDSRPLNFNHGNPWTQIGEWSRTQP